MYFTVYEIVNNLNGKKYIGKHQTNDLNDSYMGSGVLLKQAIKKYGITNFSKNILFVFDTEIEMNLKEKELVISEVVQSSMFYNIGLGGEGGPMFKGRKHSDKTKSKLSAIKSKSKGHSFSEESKKKISKSMLNNKSKLGQTIPDEVKKKISKSMTGRKHTEETKRKIREGRLRVLNKNIGA